MVTHHTLLHEFHHHFATTGRDNSEEVALSRIFDWTECDVRNTITLGGMNQFDAALVWMSEQDTQLGVKGTANVCQSVKMARHWSCTGLTANRCCKGSRRMWGRNSVWCINKSEKKTVQRHTRPE
jgi:hypothetical protein